MTGGAADGASPAVEEEEEKEDEDAIGMAGEGEGRGSGSEEERGVPSGLIRMRFHCQVDPPGSILDGAILPWRTVPLWVGRRRRPSGWSLFPSGSKGSNSSLLAAPWRLTVRTWSRGLSQPPKTQPCHSLGAPPTVGGSMTQESYSQMGITSGQGEIIRSSLLVPTPLEA